MKNCLEGCFSIVLLFIGILFFFIAAAYLNITPLLLLLILLLILISLLCLGFYNRNKHRFDEKNRESHISIDEVPFSIIKSSDTKNAGRGILYVRNLSSYELKQFSIVGKSANGQVMEYTLGESIEPGQVRTLDLEKYNPDFEVREIHLIYKLREKELQCAVYDKILNSYKVWDVPNEEGL